MKKRIVLIGLASLLIVAAGIFGMVSCNKDDAKTSSAADNAYASKVVGTWESEEYTVVFSADYTGVVKEHYEYWGSDYNEIFMMSWRMLSATTGVITVSGYEYYEEEEERTCFKLVDDNTMLIYVEYEEDGGNYQEVITMLTRK